MQTMQPLNRSPETVLPLGASSSIIPLQWLGVTTLLSSLETEVLEGFSSLMASEEDCVAASGALKGELIKCHASTTGFSNPLAGGLREAEGADGHLGDIQKSFVVEDSGNCNCDSVGALQVLGDLTQGDRVSINPGVVQSLKDGFIEVRVCSSCEEGVEL